MAAVKKKLLFLVTEDWYFCSHREPLARAAQENGYEVFVATRIGHCGQRIENEGFHVLPIKMKRSRLNPLAEVASIYELVMLYRMIRPDIVHHVALKPVLYGSLAARIVGISSVVNALAGLGFVFSSTSLKAKALRPLIRFLFQSLLAYRRSRLILQNADDMKMFVSEGITPDSIVRLIRGAGVDVSTFRPSPEPTGIPVVVLPARLLRDKGVYEFAEAARRLKSDGISARFVLVGDIDPENPSSLSEQQLKVWSEEGVIECWGWRTDMISVFSQANLVCLPSYREGLPKSLLEAAACGRAIVTTDVPGCREVVRHEYNGILVPPRNSFALAESLKLLLENPSLRMQMGIRGRQRAESEFSSERVIGETLAVYGELLAS